MRHLVLAITIAIASFISTYAQTTPTPPETPKTTSKSSSSYSISISSDDDDDGFSGTSVSIKKSESAYKFRATFDKQKTNEIKKVLMDKFGRSDLKISGNDYLWTKQVDGHNVLECKLSKGYLRLVINKDYASASFGEMISDFGIYLKDYISGSNSKEEAKKDTERASEDLERAKKELKRAEENLERSKRNLERAKKTNKK